MAGTEKKAKPVLGDQSEDIHIIPLAGHVSGWTVRVWVGGLGPSNCWIDFLNDGAVENIPTDQSIESVPQPFLPAFKMGPVAKAFGYLFSRPGGEKFAAMQGVGYRISFVDPEKRPVVYVTPSFTEGPVITVATAPVSAGGAYEL